MVIWVKELNDILLAFLLRTTRLSISRLPRAVYDLKLKGLYKFFPKALRAENHAAIPYKIVGGLQRIKT